MAETEAPDKVIDDLLALIETSAPGALEKFGKNKTEQRKFLKTMAEIVLREPEKPEGTPL